MDSRFLDQNSWGWRFFINIANTWCISYTSVGHSWRWIEKWTVEGELKNESMLDSDCNPKYVVLDLDWSLALRNNTTRNMFTSSYKLGNLDLCDLCSPAFSCTLFLVILSWFYLVFSCCIIKMELGKNTWKFISHYWGSGDKCLNFEYLTKVHQEPLGMVPAILAGGQTLFNPMFKVETKFDTLKLSSGLMIQSTS